MQRWCRIGYWRRQALVRTRFRSAARCPMFRSLRFSCDRFDSRSSACRSRRPARCCARLTSQAQRMSSMRATWWTRSCDSVASARSASSGYSKPRKCAARDCGADVGQLLAGLRALGQWRRQHATRSRRPSEWAMRSAQALQSISVSEAAPLSANRCARFERVSGARPVAGASGRICGA